MQKVANINEQNLIVFPMDELTDAQVIKLKNHLEILHHENAVILLASPLFLNNCGQQLLHFLFQYDLIHLVVMDELHLSQHFARSFRDDFDQLKRIVFSCLHPHTPCIFMTATCSSEIIDNLQHIFGFNIIHKDWPMVRDMVNRKQLFLLSIYQLQSNISTGTILLRATLGTLRLTHPATTYQIKDDTW